jgi:lipid A 3-O-deacylase
MRGQTAGLLALGAALAGAGQAQAVESVNVGVMAHNICVTDCKNAGKEQGPAVEVQANFGSPELLSLIGSPQPYVVLTLNTSGGTSSGGVGLEWSFPVSEHWAIEPGFGYVIHDGSLQNPYPSSDPRAPEFSENRVLLGSRDLFRTSIGVTRDFDGPWEAQIFFTHLSHGQIIGEGRNQGMDQLGVRFGYRFGG